jgi:hypothetical protein
VSVASPTTNAMTSPPAKKEWTFWQTIAAWIVGTACFLFIIGAMADSYCEMQMARRPIKAAIARVINKVADALGWLPFVIPFLDKPDVPNIEHPAIKADDGQPTEQDHYTFCEE